MSTSTRLDSGAGSGAGDARTGEPVQTSRNYPAIAKRTVLRTLTYVVLSLAAIVTLLPLVTIVMASLKGGREFRASGPFDAPESWFNFENYVTFFDKGNMFQAFGNTGIILAVSLVGTIAFGTMAAYAVNRFDFMLKKPIMALFLLATLVPGVTTQVATFQIISGLGLFNTRWAAIALFTGTDIVALYIFMQFLRSIPIELDEAARLDGAGPFRIYRSVILPLLTPAIATVVIIKGIAVYNEFYIPFLYMPSQKLGVVSTSLFRFKGPFGAQWEVIAAGAIVVIIPSLIAFLFLQRYIYNGLTAGATK